MHTLTPLVLAVLAHCAAAGAQQPDPRSAPAAAPAPAFVPNAGQWSGSAAFAVRGGGGMAWLDATGIDLDLVARAPDMAAEPAPPNRPGGFGHATRRVEDRLRLQFVGARPTTPMGGEQAPGMANCYAGDDASRWRSRLPTWRTVQWLDAWPGITVTAAQADRGLLQFELSCAPGVAPSGCTMRWHGAVAVTANGDGALRLTTAAGVLLQSAPIAWQTEADGSRIVRQVETVLEADGSFRFHVIGTTPDLPTIVDPVLTLIGTADDCACGVAADGNGLVYLAGYSTSAVTGRDIALYCLDTNANPPALVWSTWLGGNGDDLAFDVALDGATLTAAGWTASGNLPTLGAVQASFGGGAFDGVVAELDATTGGLNASTYVGGSGDDWCCRVATATGQPTTIAGLTTSSSLPGTTPARPFAGATDAFVVQKQIGSGAWSWSTFFGGNGHDGQLWSNWPTIHPINLRQLGLDVDASGKILLAGFTNSVNLPTTTGAWPAYQPWFAGTWDAFATILDPASAQPVVWTTYYGGSNSDSAFAARFAPLGEVVLAGDSWNAGFPATTGALQTAPGGLNDATCIWLRPQLAGAAQRRYATRLGGAANDGAFALAVDTRGHASVGGYCGPSILSGGWPLDAGGWQITFGGAQDLWLARIRPDGLMRHDLTFGSYLGGTGVESVFDLAVDRQGEVALAGATNSPTLPPPLGPTTGMQNLIGGRVEMLPVGVDRDLGGAAASCGRAPWIELDRQPAAGASFEVLVADAPPGAVGVLAFGTPIPYVTALGANLGIALPAALSPVLISSALGSQDFQVNVPASITFPVGIGVQALWLDPTCPAGQDITSSGRLAL